MDFLFEFTDAEGTAAELAVEFLTLGVELGAVPCLDLTPFLACVCAPALIAAYRSHGRVAASNGAPEGIDSLRWGGHAPAPDHAHFGEAAGARRQ